MADHDPRILNTAEYIDSRDVIARIAELEDAAAFDDDGKLIPESLLPEEYKEWRSLTTLAEKGEVLEDWNHGARLVRENWFEDYVKEYHEESLQPEERELMDRWPYKHIDWEAAAADLQSDYTDIDFDGVTYWCL